MMSKKECVTIVTPMLEFLHNFILLAEDGDLDIVGKLPKIRSRDDSNGSCQTVLRWL
jgi:hypothetical protein